MKERLQAWGGTKIIPIASCLIFNEAGQLLLLQRHGDDLGGGKWGTPGGRLDPGESPEQAAVREVYEETGLKLAEVALLGAHMVKMPHGAVHMTSFRAIVPDDIEIRIDPEEHHAHAWFNPDDLVHQENILWGVPTVLRDFALIKSFDVDPTLADGTQITFVSPGTLNLLAE